MIAKVRLKMNSLPEYIWHCWLIDRDCVCTLGSSFYITFVILPNLVFHFVLSFIRLLRYIFVTLPIFIPGLHCVIYERVFDCCNLIAWHFLVYCNCNMIFNKTRPVKTSFRDCCRWSVCGFIRFKSEIGVYFPF